MPALYRCWLILNTVTRDAVSAERPPPISAASLQAAGANQLITPLRLALLALVAAVALALAVHAGQLPHFNPDESRWLSRAHYLADLGDPLGANWTDRYMTRGQPPLGSYAMGIGLLAHGRDLQTNPPWDFSRPWEANVAIGRKPVAGDLAAGRRSSAILVAATSVVIVALANLFVSPPWAIAAGLLYAVHPFTSYIGAIAMSDALFGLLIALAALAAASLANRPGWPRAVMLGILLGLGGATKLSPLLLAPALAAGACALLVAAWIRERTLPLRQVRFAALSVAVVATATLTFVGSYPYLWPDPVGRTRQIFTFRSQEMAAQASDWPEMAVPTRAEALRRTVANFSERFTLSAAGLQMVPSGSAPRFVGQIEVAVPLIGIVAMLALAARDGPFSAKALALAILAGQCAITLLGMRSEFDRYHLPMALLGAVAAAVALERVVAVVRAAPAMIERWTGARGDTWRPLATRKPTDWFRGEGRY
jgi:hypothetical protein